VTRGDRFVVAIVVALAALAWPATYLAAAGRGDSLVVTSPSGTSELSLRPDRTVQIQGAEGPLAVEIRDGSARVVSAPCPDKLCVRQGSVSRAGSAVVCVPGGVSMRVGGGSDALDSVVR
jgi:hypothetical protein